MMKSNLGFLLLSSLLALFGAACQETSHTIPDTRLSDVGSSDARLANEEGPRDGGLADEGNANDLLLPSGMEVNTDDFATAVVCSECHSGADDATAMRDEEGLEVGYFDLWQSTMMANSARDPYWRAVVSAELAATPTRTAAIQNKCMRCHTPMASVDAERAGDALSMALLTAEGERAALGRDGVSCTTCHQIQAATLGTPESFSGGFVIDEGSVIFGPFEDPFTRPMTNRSGFTPEYGAQMDESRLCATCHELTTQTLLTDGSATNDSLPEQSPYLEWQNSQFNDEGIAGPEAANCQSCHMPTVSEAGQLISSMVARRPNGTDFPPLDDRSPIHRHTFVGGNTWIPAILRDNAEILNPIATSAAFDKTIELTRAQLRAAASVEIRGSERNGDLLTTSVRIENQSGHKFPTAYPSRRAWVFFEAVDNSGNVVFPSGAFNAEGELVDGNAQVLPSEVLAGPIQQHLETISSDDQAYVMQALMADPQGELTFVLMQAANYLKDNRLLPKGWRDEHPAAQQVGPIGTIGDTSFVAGEDTIAYEFNAPLAQGPYRVNATVLYQPISPRYAAELFAWSTVETRAFGVMYRNLDRSPETVSTVSANVP